ncbi:MAG TPA: hypothetical protein VKG62_02395, partial [Solirubrobacteraceae bacterium]|nr:hypothetical protein [Solirubrobacteraceae bacterium]
MQRKLEVGQTISRVFDIYVDQASVLMPAAAVVFVFTGIISALLVAASSGLAVLALIIYIVATTLFTGMVVELVADVQDGRRDATVRQLLNAAMPVLGKLILVGIVAGIGVVVGFFLLVIPGLILITIWALAAPVVVLERPQGLRALSRSRTLVRGNGWAVFGVILVLYLLVAVVSALIGYGAESVGEGLGLAVRVVVGILTAPLPALAASVMYFELRGDSAVPFAPMGDGAGSLGTPSSPPGDAPVEPQGAPAEPQGAPAEPPGASPQSPSSPAEPPGASPQSPSSPA